MKFVVADGLANFFRDVWYETRGVVRLWIQELGVDAVFRIQHEDQFDQTHLRILDIGVAALPGIRNTDDLLNRISILNSLSSHFHHLAEVLSQLSYRAAQIKSEEVLSQPISVVKPGSYRTTTDHSFYSVPVPFDPHALIEHLPSVDDIPDPDLFEEGVVGTAHPKKRGRPSQLEVANNIIDASQLLLDDSGIGMQDSYLPERIQALIAQRDQMRAHVQTLQDQLDQALDAAGPYLED